MDGHLGRSIVCKEGKIHIQGIHSSKNKMLRLPLSSVFNLPPGIWLITPEVWCHEGAQQWRSQAGFGEWKSMLLNPCITSIPAAMATLFKEPIE